MNSVKRVDYFPTIFTIGISEFFIWVILYSAIILRQSGFLILASFILATVNIAKFWSRRSLKKLEYRISLDKQRAFPLETLNVKVMVANQKKLPLWLRLHLPLHQAFRTGLNHPVLENETALLWYQKIEWEWELIPQYRGWHQIGPPQILAGDLLGFFQWTKPSNDQVMVAVYPRLVPLRPLFLHKMELFGLIRATGPIPDPINLVGTRDYQPGRPAKFIHWKASARHSRLQEKVCEPTAQLKILLLLDVEGFASQHAEDGFELAIEVMASLANHYNNLGYPIGLLTNAVVAGGGAAALPISHSPGQLPAILETMAKLKMEPRTDIITMLERGMELTWGVTCIFATQQPDRKAFWVRDYWAAHHVPLTVLIDDHSQDIEAFSRTPCFNFDEICECKHD